MWATVIIGFVHPTEAVGTVVDEFVGILGAYNISLNNWATRFSLYGGNTEEDTERYGNVSILDLMGVTVETSHDWIEMRFAYADQKFAF